MKRKSDLLLLSLIAALLLGSCNLPRVQIVEPTPTAIPPTPTMGVVPLQPKAELGLAENPLILALPPSASKQEQIDAAKLIADQLGERTGYAVVTVIPGSNADLVNDFQIGNAHIAVLPPYAYALVRKENSGEAVYAILKDGAGKYGAQFIANRDAGFRTYLDAAKPEDALLQFQNKKPCWSDESSPSGYVIPFGYLSKYNINTKTPAFLEGHPPVVRALYAGGICDFGATYIDARAFPSLVDQFPDVKERVIVIWHIPPIIPYDVFVFSTDMPQPMQDALLKAVAAILETTAGKQAFKDLYQIDEMQPVDDGYYSEFRNYVEASGVDLLTLIK